MDTLQLENAIRQDACLSALKHTGVLAGDELSKIKMPGAYIVNTDPSHLGGEHWLALFIDRHRQIKIFDSLGEAPKHYPWLKKYLKGRHYSHNVKRWQAPGKNTCGRFCLFYLFHKCRGWSLNDFTDFYWRSDLNENEKLVQHFVKHCFSS